MTNEKIALVLVAILFLSLNIISNELFGRARLDLTEDGLYTLSDGTLNIIDGLVEPVTLRLFFSEAIANEYPAIRTYGTRVRETLEEYAALSGGNVRLEIHDPEPFTDAQDLADTYGLQAVPAEPGEFLYFGLVAANTTDDQEIIPFFSSEREAFLEYDLTRMIQSLSRADQATIGLITSLPLITGASSGFELMQGITRPLAVYDQMEDMFVVRHLPDGFDAVDPDIDVLLLARPPDFDADTLYAIDQFVLRGGRLLLFLDPYAEIANRPDPTGFPRDTTETDADNLDPLLRSWGVDMPATEVVADRRMAQRVSTMTSKGQEQLDYVIWLAVTDEFASDTDIVTSGSAELNLATAGHIVTFEDATTTIEPLITSSTDAMLLDASFVSVQPEPDALMQDFAATGEAYVIAARISGNVASAFPEGPPGPRNEIDEDAEEDLLFPERQPHLGESADGINVILVADSDIFDDRFWVNRQNFLGQEILVPVADNGTFIINALDNLSGSGDLISLRSRTASFRPFTVVQDIRQDAEFRYLAEEQALLERLDAAEQQLADLRNTSPTGGSGLPSAEQEAAIDAFRQDMISTRQELRDVQFNLRADIDSLETRLKVINIGLVPAIFALGALAVVGFRRRRARAGA